MNSLSQYILEKFKIDSSTERVNNKHLESERKAKERQEKKELDRGTSYYIVYYDKVENKLHCKEVGFFPKSSEGKKQAEEYVADRFSKWEESWKENGWKRIGVKKRYQINSLPARDIDFY